MPHATMPDIDIASPNPFILIKEPKLGTKTAQATNSSANTTSMPKLSQIRPKRMPLRCCTGGVPEVADEDIIFSSVRPQRPLGWF